MPPKAVTPLCIRFANGKRRIGSIKQERLSYTQQGLPLVVVRAALRCKNALLV